MRVRCIQVSLMTPLQNFNNQIKHIRTCYIITISIEKIHQFKSDSLTLIIWVCIKQTASAPEGAKVATEVSRRRPSLADLTAR